jgi:hypothetical protein
MKTKIHKKTETIKIKKEIKTKEISQFQEAIKIRYKNI